MQRTLQAKATVTTDLGEFTALAAAYSVDRDGERIVPGAFKDTIHRWQGSGKQIPLHWNHSADPKDIIGTVDPTSMMETEDGLTVTGKLDLENSEQAREAWRAMKTGSMSLSFGFMVNHEGLGTDGVNELKKVDLFEITVTPSPANADTRFIDMKALKATMTPAEMEAEIEAMRNRLDQMETMVHTMGKATWTTAYVNALPDSAFLHIEGGGTKDSDGKTVPRSLRMFPYKDVSGAVDLPHLRNALARIPQSNLSQSLKDSLTAKAQRILDNNKSVEDGKDEEPDEGQVEPQDQIISDIRRIHLEVVRS